MRAIRIFGHQILGILLCLALVVWSVTPSFTHAPTVFETIHDHLEMIADHGHSHGLEEDLYWAMHGHGHDVADHDHTHACLLTENVSEPVLALSEMRAGLFAMQGPARLFRIDRPPRV